MRRGLRARALVLLLPLALIGCGDIGLDNLGEFVVTYKVTVTSDRSEEVLVSISTPDVQRRVSLRSGSVTATAFKPGVVTVRVGDSGQWTFEMEAKARTIGASLESGLLDADAAKALLDELLKVHKARSESGPWVTCTTEVKAGPQASGEGNLVYVVGAAPDGTPRLSGPGC